MRGVGYWANFFVEDSRTSIISGLLYGARESSMKPTLYRYNNETINILLLYVEL